MMVNKFLVYWPMVAGHLSAKANARNFKTCLKGTSQQTLTSMIKSLGIKGYDEGGSILINKRGNPIVKSFVRYNN